MAIHKLRQLGESSFGLTLPVDDLRDDGLVSDGEQVACNFRVVQVAPGCFVAARTDRYELVDVGQVKREAAAILESSDDPERERPVPA